VKSSPDRPCGHMARLRSLYLARCNLQFPAEAPQVTISPDRRDIFITLTVHEGEPYKVRNVRLAGDLLELEPQLQQLVQVQEGEVFSAAKTNATVQAISEYLGSLGYAFANVNP